LHRQGWTHPAADAGGVSRQGVDFFAGAVEKPDLNNPIVDENGDPVLDGDGNPTYGTYLDVSGVTAGNIDISDALKESVYNIAASSDECVLDDSDSGKLKVGNNKTMSALFNLQVNPSIQLIRPDTTAGALAGATVNRGIGTFSGQISSITMDIATTLNNTDKKVATGTTLLLAADTQRTSISGVSLDEEMTSLIKYNHAYNGASRVITAMDEALDRIINSMGLVGRS
jgi:flagellar hook-associated protein 1 FlgK